MYNGIKYQLPLVLYLALKVSVFNLSITIKILFQLSQQRNYILHFYEMYPKISFGNFSGLKCPTKRHVCLEPVNVIIFGKRVSNGITELILSSWDHRHCPCKIKKRRPLGKPCQDKRAERLQWCIYNRSKDCRESPKARREAREWFSQSLQMEPRLLTP